MATPSIPLKRCSRKSDCLHPESNDGWLPASPDYFMRHKGKLYSQCHFCRRDAKRQSHTRNREHNNARTQRWMDAHPEYYVEKHRRKSETSPEYVERNRKRALEWRESHLEYARAREHSWYHADPERARARKRQSYKKDPTAAKLSARARKLRLRSANGAITPADIRLQRKSQTDKRGRLRCWWCGGVIRDGKFHIDHRIPLSRGGSNTPDNLCISCPTCNLSKGAKLPQEWNGRLL